MINEMQRKSKQIIFEKPSFEIKKAKGDISCIFFTFSSYFKRLHIIFEILSFVFNVDPNIFGYCQNYLRNSKIVVAILANKVLLKQLKINILSSIFSFLKLILI